MCEGLVVQYCNWATLLMKNEGTFNANKWAESHNCKMTDLYCPLLSVQRQRNGKARCVWKISDLQEGEGRSPPWMEHWWSKSRGDPALAAFHTVNRFTLGLSIHPPLDHQPPHVQGRWNLCKYDFWSTSGSWRTSHGGLGQDGGWLSVFTIRL